MDRDLKSEAAGAVPITVLTGFLGSGKTTLLNRLLGHPDMGETAVLINEFGEVGVDHLLVRNVTEDVVLLNSGCLCCTVRGDLVDSLRELFLQRVRGDVPEFRRLLVETTGLADPAPVIHTLMTDPLIASRYRLDGIVTTVDGAHGMGQLDSHPEAVKQAAVADRLVLTKTDVASEDSVVPLSERLYDLNPSAPILQAVQGDIAPDALFDAGLFNARNKHPDVARWLNAEAYAQAGKQIGHADPGHADHHHRHDHDHNHDRHGHDVNRHDDRIRSFCLRVPEPVVWDAFARFMDLLLAAHGENFLRVKGLLKVDGHDVPVAVHGVQHMFHPPVALPAWPDGDPRDTRLVFITRDIDPDVVEKLWRTLVGPAGAQPE